MKTIAFHTLGCKLNYSETSAIARKCRQSGFECIEHFETQADVYVLNTCSVTENADKEARQIIRKALKRNPVAKVVVMGCYAQLQPEKILEIRGVNAVIGTNDKFRLAEILNSLKDNEALMFHGGIQDVNHFSPSSSFGSRTRSFLKVQDGCDYPCTYCTIPMARGKSRSGTPEQILKELQLLKEQGIKEVVLTGVNTGDYGIFENSTKKEIRFIDLMKILEDNSKGIERFRISSIEPNLLSREIIEFVHQSEKFMPHFHIPLQSGSNAILAKMKRRYRRELYAEKVLHIKSLMPQACIGVDVMTGFPGETDEFFEETRRFLHDLPVSYLHVFTYSKRPGTEAYSMHGHVDEKVKKERNKILRNLSDKKSFEFYSENLLSEKKVLIEKVDSEGNAFGHTENYIYAKFRFNVNTGVNQLQMVRLLEVVSDNNGQLLATAEALN